MVLYGVQADVELSGDLWVDAPLEDEGEYLLLLRGEPSLSRDLLDAIHRILLSRLQQPHITARVGAPDGVDDLLPRNPLVQVAVRPG